MQQVYWRALTRKYNFRNTQSFPRLSAIHCVIDENLPVVAGECLTVSWKLICIKEQAELNIAKENYGIKKRNWDVHKSTIWQNRINIKISMFYAKQKIYLFCPNFNITFSSLVLIFDINTPYISFRNRDIKKHWSVIFL